MSATARVAAPHTPRTRAGARASLTVAPEARAAVAGNGIFALVVVGLLLAGMVMLLVLNTSLAQGAFEIGSLTKTQDALAVSEQQLLQQVARAEAPESLQPVPDPHDFALRFIPYFSVICLCTLLQWTG